MRAAESTATLSLRNQRETQAEPAQTSISCQVDVLESEEETIITPSINICLLFRPWTGT